MRLYKPLGILSKVDNKLKNANATVLFPRTRKEHYSVKVAFFKVPRNPPFKLATEACAKG